MVTDAAKKIYVTNQVVIFTLRLDTDLLYSVGVMPSRALKTREK